VAGRRTLHSCRVRVASQEARSSCYVIAKAVAAVPFTDLHRVIVLHTLPKSRISLPQQPVIVLYDEFGLAIPIWWAAGHGLGGVEP
jgi:hypothetical protein